jgi:hypothetical protein
MIQSAGTFDAWGSALVGGVVSAFAVLIGVGLTQYLVSRDSAKKERRTAAVQLMVEVSNLRDEACSHRAGTSGDYALYPLRNALATTYATLHGFNSYQVVEDFYRTVRDWRTWARDRKQENLTPPLEVSFIWVREYRAELRHFGNRVVKVLQDDALEVPPGALDFEEPVLPPLVERAAGIAQEEEAMRERAAQRAERGRVLDL